MSRDITLKIDQELLEKVKIIAQNKNPLRKIDSYAEAVRESLIDFVNKNKKILEENIQTQDQEQNQEVPT